MESLEGIQRRSMKMMIKLENLSFEERLTDLVLFHLEKGRLLGDVTVVF